MAAKMINNFTKHVGYLEGVAGLSEGSAPLASPTDRERPTRGFQTVKTAMKMAGASVLSPAVSRFDYFGTPNCGAV